MGGFSQRGGWWVVGQFALLAAILAALGTGGSDWGWGARLIGGMLAGAGCLLAGSGLVALGGSLSPFPAPRPGAALVEKGAYRMVRHPIYGGICLGASGLGLIDGNPLVITGAAALVAYLWAKSGREEQRLVAHLPDYAGYRSRVRRRLIPWVI